MNIFRIIIIVAILLIFSETLFATGPSTAIIKIIPICCNEKGIVLCKTYCCINFSGAYTFHRVEFGWLVLSSDGIWEEIPHIILDPGEKEENIQNLYNLSELYFKEFENKINWKSPPKTVIPLIKKYNFINCNVEMPSQDSVLSSHVICKNGKCKNIYLNQQSIKGFKSINGEFTTIKSYFYHKGIAFFHNAINIEDEKILGSYIHIPNEFEGEDIGIDYWDIDGVTFIKHNWLK